MELVVQNVNVYLLPLRVSLAHLGAHLAYSATGRAEHGDDELAIVSLGITAQSVQHFPDCGHWLPAEASDEVSKRLRAFFSS